MVIHLVSIYQMLLRCPDLCWKRSLAFISALQALSLI